MDEAAGCQRVRHHYVGRGTPACLLLHRATVEVVLVLVLVVLVLPQVVLVLGVEA